MHFQSQLIYKLTLGTFLMLWAQTSAEVLRDEASLNNLYNNLLQREYAGPVVFPNHQVERKAQRSPSLRLRFGRRSDPDLFSQTPEKRWFGEVNQKPIRSPSLRLRFGRRSDPSMPMHSPYDILMNGQQMPENNDDYNEIYDAYYNRVVRKPQRLRFGRSLPFQTMNAVNENDLLESGDDNNDMTLPNSEDEFYNTLIHSQKLRNLLMSLNKYGAGQYNEGIDTAEEDMDEFERAIRKPGPLRLRWGRSTGGRSSMLDKEIKGKDELEQKNKVSEVVNDVVDKSVNQQNKD
ncbi:short neuropeptide F [Lucilia cuprina]|uniref:short neuropeptide F n=1 Tax=Lucilia cuprina TaxID=7375 RepID=UPI001F05DFED|nr:short neuropeptide F [Lucilia cuprina]